MDTNLMGASCFQAATHMRIAAVALHHFPVGNRISSVFVSRALHDASGCTKNYTDTDTQVVRNHMENSIYDPIRKEPRFLALLSAE